MPHELAPTLRERWLAVRDGLESAIRAAGRASDEVLLVAVSKFHPADAIRELAALGQRDFGENYMQEARAKQAELAKSPFCPDVRWHANTIAAMSATAARMHTGMSQILFLLLVFCSFGMIMHSFRG